MKNFSTLKKYAELAWSTYGDFGDKNPSKKILEDIFYNAFPNFSTSTKIVSEPFCNCKKSSNKVVSF